MTATLELPTERTPGMDDLLHYASRESGYERALCGRRRDRPLRPYADGTVCVVCAELHAMREKGWSPA